MLRSFKRLFSSEHTASAKAEGGKDFVEDLRRFVNWIESEKNFALVRFGDGEMKIINGEETDYSHKKHAEHTYRPELGKDEKYRALLQHSLLYQSDSYYVGIACPCCVGEEKFFALKNQSQQSESHLTWANIFVNSNFLRFKEWLIPALKKRQVVFIGNEAARPENLSFALEHYFPVGANAWVADSERLIQELSDYIETKNIQDYVFIFCAGVASNIVIAQLHQKYPENTYIDVGSTFDVELGLGKTRKYLRKGKTLKKTCVWA